MIRAFDIVTLIMAKDGYEPGTRATVVMVHNDGEAFEVEVCSDVLTVAADEICR